MDYLQIGVCGAVGTDAGRGGEEHRAAVCWLVNIFKHRLLACGRFKHSLPTATFLKIEQEKCKPARVRILQGPKASASLRSALSERLPDVQRPRYIRDSIGSSEVTGVRITEF